MLIWSTSFRPFQSTAITSFPEVVGELVTPPHPCVPHPKGPSWSQMLRLPLQTPPYPGLPLLPIAHSFYIPTLPTSLVEEIIVLKYSV